MSQTASSASPLTLTAYVSELDRLASALQTAHAADADVLSAGVPLRWRVRMEPREIAVDGTWLIHGLRDASASPERWPSRRDALRKRLLEMRAHAADQLAVAPSKQSRDDVRKAVAIILTGPEFRRSMASQRLERLQQLIAEWVRSLLERAGARGLARRETAIVVAWIAAVAAFAGLGIWLARFLDTPGRGRRSGLAQAQPRRVSPREWAQRALTAARSGDVREAVRCAYNCAIRRVEEQGTWRLDQARTPREYLRMLPPDDTRRAPVQDLTEQFEQIWYGNRTVNEDDVRRITVSLERLGCLPAERAI